MINEREVNEVTQKRIESLVRVIEKGYRYANHKGLREREDITSEDMYSYVNAVWVLMEDLHRSRLEVPETRAQVDSVYNFVTRQRTSLRPTELDLNEEGEIARMWFLRNKEEVTQYFLGAMRIKRVIDSGYQTGRFQRSLMAQAASSGRYKFP
jgi:hypothetical protein